MSCAEPSYMGNRIDSTMCLFTVKLLDIDALLFGGIIDSTPENAYLGVAYVVPEMLKLLFSGQERLRIGPP